MYSSTDVQIVPEQQNANINWIQNTFQPFPASANKMSKYNFHFFSSRYIHITLLCFLIAQFIYKKLRAIAEEYILSSNSPDTFINLL